MNVEPVPATWFQMSDAPGSAAWPRSDDGALGAPSSHIRGGMGGAWRDHVPGRGPSGRGAVGRGAVGWEWWHQWCYP